MFAKLFHKHNQSQQPPSSTQSNAPSESMALSELSPRIAVHYGIPSTASILAFDPIQCLLAVGTLDGRIKVIGGDNIEGLLISPKPIPFKNLEFLQNQGFLVSVSNENEIQVWDLEKRCISSNVQWESNITAFSVISGTNFMYAGDEYGFLSVLKYDAEEQNILQLPYHVPPNIISEGAGITLPDQLSIVGVFSQPGSGNRVLIAYENGLIILWDVTEDKAIHVKGYKDLQLKGGTVVNFSNNEGHTFVNEPLDTEEAEKDISSLCWVSPDGSVLAVGYVDGDILLWDLSVSDKGKEQGNQKSPNDVVKIQLSSGDRRLPVIVLHWCSNIAKNGCGGQLFVYGGEDIGSAEVLTILDLDWSSGLGKLKCIERVDLTLHGSFADLIIIPNAYKSRNSNEMSVFVLSSPGLLHYYEYASVSALKSGKGKEDHSVHPLQYHSVIPTVEPYMTVGELYMMDSERNNFTSLSQTVLPAKQQSENRLIGRTVKWPLTGGVPSQLSTEDSYIERVYIGGYQDGSVRIWDATFPVLSLVCVLAFEIKGVQVAGASASISALDLCSINLTLAVGNESGVVFLYRLQRNSTQTSVTVVTETKSEAYNYLPEERNHCSTIYSILNSPVCALRYATSGVRLVAGFESGQVAVLDTGSPSVLFVTDCVPSLRSPIISLAVKSCPDTHENSIKESEDGTGSETATEIAFILTRDAHMVLMESTSGNMISSQTINPKGKSNAIGMHLLDMECTHAEEGTKTDSPKSSQHIKAQKNQSDSPKVEAYQALNLDDRALASQILICCEEAFYIYPLKSLIQGDNNFIHKLNLEKPCSWTGIFKRDAERYGFMIVYQTGEIEIRSLPDLKPLGNTSMTSILRWNFKNNMDKTMSASDKGQITMVSGSEFAFVSLLAFENEFRFPQSLPCLHDKAVAAATDADVNFSQNQKKAQIAMRGFVSNIVKGLKGDKDEQDMDYKVARQILIAHLDKIFSRFPFSDSCNLDDMDLEIDDINIDLDEPLVVKPLENINEDTKGKSVPAKATEKEKLFEGGSSTNTKPTTRTREEIIAKYRGADAAAAASQAKDKLMERGEKLQQLSDRTEELQSGAQNFADLAHELAKQMEKRKWWNI